MKVNFSFEYLIDFKMSSVLRVHSSSTETDMEEITTIWLGMLQSNAIVDHTSHRELHQ